MWYVPLSFVTSNNEECGCFEMSSSEERKEFTAAVRVNILIKQKLLCKKCRVMFTAKSRPQFDHIKGSSDNRISNCQALCPNCHEIKNQKQALKEAKRRREANKK